VIRMADRSDHGPISINNEQCGQTHADIATPTEQVISAPATGPPELSCIWSRATFHGSGASLKSAVAVPVPAFNPRSDLFGHPWLTHVSHSGSGGSGSTRSQGLMAKCRCFAARTSQYFRNSKYGVAYLRTIASLSFWSATMACKFDE
jgi:hypothetical protein